MPTPKIRQQFQNQIYFLTFRVLEWINIFTEPVYSSIIINCLKYSQKHKGLLIHGYVIMTNYIHLIISSKKCNLISIVKEFKSYSTSEIKNLLYSDNRRYILRLIKNSFYKRKNQAFQLWNSSNWPILIESDKFFIQKLEYIHNNPVKKQYVDEPEYWLYSSARNYLLNDDTILKVDKLFYKF